MITQFEAPRVIDEEQPAQTEDDLTADPENQDPDQDASTEEDEGEPPEDPPVATEADEPEGDGDDNNDLLNQIFNAELECRRKESVVEDLKEELKEAKASLDTAVTKLRRLCNQIHDTDRPLFDQKPNTDSETAEQPEDEPSESWRDESITALNLASIKGFGDKKIEALTELCPTLGAFEDLRAKVGTDAATLAELMPRGIGEAATEQIENMQMEWVARWHAQSDDDTETDLTAEQQAVYDRSEQLKGEPLCCQFPDNGIHMAGRNAFYDDDFVWSCPWEPGDKQDEWIRGYLSAKLDHENPQEDQPEEVNDLEDLLG